MHPQHHACRRRRGTDTAVATVATGAVRATCRIGCVVRLSAAGAHHAVGVVIALVMVMSLMAVMDLCGQGHGARHGNGHRGDEKHRDLPDQSCRAVEQGQLMEPGMRADQHPHPQPAVRSQDHGGCQTSLSFRSGSSGAVEAHRQPVRRSPAACPARLRSARLRCRGYSRAGRYRPDGTAHRGTATGRAVHPWPAARAGPASRSCRSRGRASPCQAGCHAHGAP